MKKLYLVIELRQNAVPRIVGLYRTKAAAEGAAYAPGQAWCNIIELPVQG